VRRVNLDRMAFSGGIENNGQLAQWVAFNRTFKGDSECGSHTRAENLMQVSARVEGIS